jgi:hypothetical protein
MCNITIINNYYARLQDLILRLKFPMGTRKYLFENYRQFGQALSNTFASPHLGDVVRRTPLECQCTPVLLHTFAATLQV